MSIIHRDIKAENILIDVQENVRIADFGLCYIQEKPLDLAGTIQFMAREMLHNVKNSRSMEYGFTVDWWTFGCVLYELVSCNHQALFATEEAVIDYVSWHKQPDIVKLFPAFDKLDPSVAFLVAGTFGTEAIWI
ncbi:kinase-like domain-containing protein [Suillus clintonianus]|uniref:kinase-like domain-containing protein n=1 Tax=Suillus clintonianus TaxID=1904413 RepID=UPI001B88144C|nr:kinase-like domain-containing protein [Suillus clintonianus]KAG2128256.1 kinase-like domain-containing protein [Suillus clintonianus]